MANGTLRVTLRLKTVDHLFDGPDLSPFDPYYAPYSFAAGMDFLVGEMRRLPRAARTELTVLLPGDQITPDLEERTRAAICRYSETWAAEARQTHDVEQRKARIALVVALLFFAVANSFYLWFWQSASFFGYSGIPVEVLVEGVSILSWVTLWWPLDQLLHTTWERRLDERAYRALRGIALGIAPDPDPPGPV